MQEEEIKRAESLQSQELEGGDHLGYNQGLECEVGSDEQPAHTDEQQQQEAEDECDSDSDLD